MFKNYHDCPKDYRRNYFAEFKKMLYCLVVGGGAILLLTFAFVALS